MSAFAAAFTQSFSMPLLCSGSLDSHNTPDPLIGRSTKNFVKERTSQVKLTGRLKWWTCGNIEIPVTSNYVSYIYMLSLLFILSLGWMC